MRAAVRALRTILVLSAIALVAACVPCLNPLYTEADLVVDDGVLGAWVDEDGESWVFEKAGEKSYTLTYHPETTGPPPPEEPGRPARFDAHLVRLGEDLFLDLYPDSYPDQFDVRNALMVFHLIPAHTFSRIWIDKDSIRIAMLDPEWLEKALGAGQVHIDHKQGEEGILITASTAELQSFAASIATNTEAFGVVTELVREGTREAES